MKKRASRCSQCGSPAPGAWRKCPTCRSWVGVESPFCWSCGGALHPEAQNHLAAGRWRRDADVFAVRIETDGIERELKHGLTLDVAETALVLKNGLCTAILGAGRHAAGDVAESTIVLLDGSELATPLAFEAVQSSDGLHINLDTEIVFQVNRRRLAGFVARLLGASRRITYAALSAQLADALLGCVRKQCRRFDILALCHDHQALTRLEEDLRADFAAALEPLGMELVQLGTTAVSGDDADRIRSHAADAAAAIAEKEAQGRVDALERKLEALGLDEQLGVADKKRRLQTVERDLEIAKLEHARRVAEQNAAIAMIRRAAIGEASGCDSACCLAVCEDGAPVETGSRITLETDGLLIHILPCHELLIGCRRTCDIIARLFDPNGNVDAAQTKRISRHHARLAIRRGRVYVADGAMPPDSGEMRASAMGTFLDGERVTFGDEQPLPFGREFVVSLASAGANGRSVFALRGEVRRCDELRHEGVAPELHMDAGAMSCMVLQRCDPVPEVFVVVWKYLPLWMVDESLRGFCICRNKDGLALGDKETCRRLAPGLAWTRGDTSLVSREWEQWGGLRERPAC